MGPTSAGSNRGNVGERSARPFSNMKKRQVEENQKRRIVRAIDFEIFTPMEIFEDLTEILAGVMGKNPEYRLEFAERLEALRSDMLVHSAWRLRQTSPDLN